MKRTSSSNRVFWFAAFVGIAPVGCATSGARPDDMSSRAHRAAASEHAHEAEQHEAQYDPQRTRSRRRPGASFEAGADYVDYNPTAHHLSTAKRHQRHARDHAAAANALESFEEAECGSFAPAVRAVCPLLGQVTAVKDIPQGVRVRFAEGVHVDAAAAHIRCHLAYAAVQGGESMAQCPLYLRGIESQTSGLHTVDLTVEDDETVRALRHRTHAHVAD